jgi:hypothetical protein
MKRMGQKIVVFLFFILFFSLFFMLEKEKFTTNKYSFIHIPKTSGIAFRQFVNDSYSDHISIENHHVIATQYNNPIIIIREPYDRFFSMYHYWRQDIDNEKIKKTSIKEFINYIKTDDDILITNKTEIYHYFPQSYYLPTNAYGHTIVIVHTKNNELMNRKVNEMIDYLGIPNKNTKYNETNVSKKESEIVLDENDKKEVEKLYENDFVLWRMVNDKPYYFKKVF